MSDDTVVVGTNNGVYFVAPSGVVKTQFPTPSGEEGTPLVMPDGTVVVGSDDNNVYFLGLK